MTAEICAIARFSITGRLGAIVARHRAIRLNEHIGKDDPIVFEHVSLTSKASFSTKQVDETYQSERCPAMLAGLSDR
jgi:hypothetical protein